MAYPIASINTPSQAPVAIGGKAQPRSPRGPRIKVVKVKAHTRTVKVKPKAPPKPKTDPYAAQIKSAIALKYDPQYQALNQQIGTQQQTQQRAQTWYQDYLNTLQAQRQQQNQAAQNIATSLAQYNPQAAQTGNASADALAAQAQASQHYLGQAFAGQQSQMALDAANRISNGLIPGASLQSQRTQQDAANQIGQLQSQRGQVKSQAGAYGTQLRGQFQAADAKAANDAENLAIKQGTLDYLTGNAQSEAQNRVAGQKVARSNVRIKRTGQADTRNQNAVNNALRAGTLAERAANDAARLNKNAGHNKGNGTYTTANLNKYDNQWRGALALGAHLKAAKTYVDKTTKKTVPVTQKVVYSALLKQYPNDPEFASAAAAVVFGGRPSSHDIHVLSTKGVHPKLPKTWGDELPTVIRLLKGK